MADISVIINDKTITISADSTLVDVIKSQGLPSDGCAIAVNNKVVPRSKWDSIQMQKGDILSVFRAIAGG
ncbi:thiamine biosynthesis protein ThiS [Vibrio sp. UCD-FRSSP16_10]|uniref:sulfur carrier protein ThiS n=1 Tax=unclassified Vibrio TaxID=2614977 RepID=UPI000801D211|nr:MULTISPECIES: sulfur carrier protein ThiS [unclassified Vibrio]OBT12899.1 thiamine biosynthesis protein ThiS [Vibrio sp. UCD-FRSSP16_30]OBT18362.1 thiamine biosynthesis protein ThiS [Vibrio sp. UCD-FRSSP16_10]